jgi:hypothetical protein
MPEESKNNQETSPIGFIHHHFHWFLTIFVILVGTLFLLWAAKLEKYSTSHDVLRDIGLALLIAAVVGATYEVFARSHFIRDTMAAMLSKILGDIVRDDIWDEVKDQIIKKEMMRENMDIFLGISSDLDPLCNPTTLWMKFNYELRGLHSRPKKKTIELMHFLDDHIKSENLPRFESIEVDGKKFPTDSIVDGKFTTLVELNNKEGTTIGVIIERYESTYIPGSYNLTMTEMTKGIELFLTDIPDGIKTIVNIRPHVEKVSLEKGQHLHFHDIILLPGQSIEFRFVHRRDLGSEAMSSQSIPPQETNSSP